MRGYELLKLVTKLKNLRPAFRKKIERAKKEEPSHPDAGGFLLNAYTKTLFFSLGSLLVAVKDPFGEVEEEVKEKFKVGRMDKDTRTFLGRNKITTQALDLRVSKPLSNYLYDLCSLGVHTYGISCSMGLQSIWPISSSISIPIIVGTEGEKVRKLAFFDAEILSLLMKYLPAYKMGVSYRNPRIIRGEDYYGDAYFSMGSLPTHNHVSVNTNFVKGLEEIKKVIEASEQLSTTFLKRLNRQMLVSEDIYD